MARNNRSVKSAAVPPCVLTIFGVTGDLTKRLLLPSLYNLAAAGSLPNDFRLVGVGRRDWGDRTLREYLGACLKQFLAASPDARIVHWLAQRCFYQKTAFDDQVGFVALARRTRQLGTHAGVAINRLFYLAVAPEFIATIVHRLDRSGQIAETGSSWTRVIVEKPFGHDLASAAALNAQLLKRLKERQLYRIDHFAGKDAVQDLAIFRFGNAIFEPLWHRSLVDNVQITVAETVGLEGRAGFYEHSGALRDMVPNHLMELLSHIAMEPPVSFSVEHVRQRQLELLESVRPIRPRDVNRSAVRGQYSAGKVGRKVVPAYREEKDVSPRSQTETYVALQLAIDNWRWSGVPFFLRTGKSLAKSVTEIAVQFRPAPARLFPDIGSGTAPPNQIVFEMKPRQGIYTTFCARAPGLGEQSIPAEMAYEFPEGPFGNNAKGYEGPLRDAMLGEPLLFPSAAFVEQGWRLVQPLLDAWSKGRKAPLARYPAGSQGPREADALLAQSGHRWRLLD